MRLYQETWLNRGAIRCMKNILTALAIGSTVLTACTKQEPPSSPRALSIDAAPVPVMAPRLKPPTPEQILQSLVTKYDVNKDNVVTTDEMLSVTLDGLYRASARHDKTLSQAEFHLALGDRTLQDKAIDKVFTRVDSNHNGILNEAELTAYVWPSIQALNKKAQSAQSAAPAAK